MNIDKYAETDQVKKKINEKEIKLMFPSQSKIIVQSYQ